MKLWDEYIDLLKPAGEVIAKTWAPQSDKARAELCRQLAMNISQGYTSASSGDHTHDHRRSSQRAAAAAAHRGTIAAALVALPGRDH